MILSRSKDAVDAAGAVHVLEQLAELLRLGLGGVDDGLGLLQRAPRHAGHLGDLVGGATLEAWATCPDGFAARRLPLPLLRRRPLDRLQRALDGDRFRQREVLAVRVLGELGFQRLGIGEVADDDRDLGLAELLGTREPSSAAHQLYRPRPSGRTTMGSSMSRSAMLAASPSMSPMSLRWRERTTISSMWRIAAPGLRFNVMVISVHKRSSTAKAPPVRGVAIDAIRFGFA